MAPTGNTACQRQSNTTGSTSSTSRRACPTPHRSPSRASEMSCRSGQPTKPKH
ncbi:hypothetical protein CB0940_04795 [Cercospora beticola]|uniref:Uncharacterized protein n=1 Tax=Cercospora beticola TaxID=122368 RepID=A0A2G5HKM8_CERBT|nr:hypothetical protein CB0940_04795 [Cercospora beticola]PIA93121.1 hypothetical protein CB0940_04795 [Cercospora beticola]